MDISILTLQSKFLKRRDSPNKGGSASYSTMTLERMRSLLAIAPTVRAESQINAVIGLTKHLKFFEELRESVGEFGVYLCCRHLAYTPFPAGKCVFREGDTGNQFYVILSGSCSVLTRIQNASNSTDFQLLTVLRPGDSFGELSLICNRPRAATVFCREACDLAVLEQQDYADILKRVQERQLDEKIALLRLHPVFSTWPLDNVSSLSHFFQPRSLKRRQVLFSAGQPAHELFLIQNGSFQVTKEVSQMVLTSGFTKAMRKQTVVTTVKAGELLCVGNALVMGLYHSSCVCTSLAGTVLVIDAKNFKRIVSSEEAVNALIEAERDGGQPGKKAKEEESKGGVGLLPSHLNWSVVVKPKGAGKAQLEKSMHVSPSQLYHLSSSKPPKILKFFHKRTPSMSVTELSLPDKPSHQRVQSVTDPSELDLDPDSPSYQKSSIVPLPLLRMAAKSPLRHPAIPRNPSLPSLSTTNPV